MTKPVPAISAENFEEVYKILYPDRKSLEEVYAQIIEDLVRAVNFAPTAYGPNKMRGPSMRPMLFLPRYMPPSIRMIGLKSMNIAMLSLPEDSAFAGL